MDSSQPSQLEQYIPVLFLLAAAVGFAVATLVASVLFGKFAKSSKAKDAPYECGKDPIGEGGARFSVKFYLVAMLFILFDIEVVFMYPWAVVYRDMVAGTGPLAGTLQGFLHRTEIFWSMLSFVLILTVGYVYAIMKGALDWKK